MWLFALLFTCCALLLAWLLWERKKCLSVWESRGIPGPEPDFIWGNIKQIGEMGIHNAFDKWHAKYGKMFGYYEGAKPVLVTSDLELIKQVLVKNFHQFHGRKIIPFMSPDDEYANMVRTNGERWKLQRSVCSPTFTAIRMKQMSPMINESVNSLMTLFDKRSAAGKPFDIYGDFQKLTLTVIGSCAFGMDLDALDDKDNMFLTKCREVFDSIENRSLLLSSAFLMSAICPKLVELIGPTLFYSADPGHEPWMLAAAKEMITSRKDSKSSRVDVIDLLLKASAEKKANEDVHSFTMDADKDATLTEEEHLKQAMQDHGNPKDKSTKKKLSMPIEEMIGQVILFLIAGYETTSTALGYCSYNLALNPSVQAKLQQEIDTHFPEQDLKPDYLMIQKLPYLDMVVSETLRLHPVGQIATHRQCFEDCTLEGVPFKKGDAVQIHMNAVHMDPEQWGPEDPKEFVPERFEPERKKNRHPMAFMAFGNGPRNCIGMRFALMEAKIALIRLLKEYTIKKCDKTAVPLPVKRNSVVSPSGGVWVTLQKR